MNSWTSILGLWLADFYFLATFLLLSVSISMYFIRQPVRRLATAWGTMIGLVLLAVACSLPTWPRVQVITKFQNHIGGDSLSVSDGNQARVATAVASPDALAGRKLEKRFSSDDDETVELSLLVPVQATAAALPPLEPRPAMSLEQWATLVFYAFSAGFVIVALWLAWGHLRATGLCKKAISGPAEIRTELSEIMGTARRTPRLLLSSEIANAVAMGIVRPTILLPSRFADEEHRDGLRLVLAHEWAHIQHKDLWLLAVHRSLLLILFAHPLYWWLRCRIRDDQEALADATAASRTNSNDYAMKLLSWARISLKGPTPRISATLGIWERPSQFSRRITMLYRPRGETAVFRVGRRW